MKTNSFSGHQTDALADIHSLAVAVGLYMYSIDRCVQTQHGWILQICWTHSEITEHPNRMITIKISIVIIITTSVYHASFKVSMS